MRKGYLALVGAGATPLFSFKPSPLGINEGFEGFEGGVGIERGTG